MGNAFRKITVGYVPLSSEDMSEVMRSRYVQRVILHIVTLPVGSQRDKNSPARFKTPDTPMRRKLILSASTGLGT